MPPPRTTVVSSANPPLAACTPKTITSAARLREELEATWQWGYALDDEELEEGIGAISAPIWNIDGNVIAALSTPGPISRMPPQCLREIVEALVEAANAISAHVLRA